MPRQILILLIVLPIAALMGYLLADPLQTESLAGIGMVIGALLLPLALKWHHPMLVLAWNASVILTFLPGDPYLWMFMGVLSFGFTILHRFLDPNFRFIHVPSVTWTLLLVALVVMVTAKLTGGFGMRSLGGNVYGGKKYFYIWFAIIGFFALSTRRISGPAVPWLAGGFFASGVTTMMSTFAYMLGPAAWVLYAIFPTSYAMHLAALDYGTDFTSAGIARYSGLSVAGMALMPVILIRYGLRGLLDWMKPWRMGMMLAVLGISMLGGYRTTLVFFCLLMTIQFFLEGLHRTKWLPITAASSVLALAILMVTAGFLPMSIQRSLTVIKFLPLSKAARMDAEGSSQWRKDMWKRLAAERDRYFWVGKGLTASARNYYLEIQAQRYGLAEDFELTILTGDYHNGPLTVMIPFGIWGVIAMLLFVGAALRVLWLNRNAGTGWLPNINRVLLSVFVTKVIIFLGVFGEFSSEFYAFTGLVALSISLNGGIASAKAPVTVPVKKPEAVEPVVAGGDPVPGSV